MNKIVITIVAAVLATLIGVYAYYSGKEYVVRVSEQEIINKVDEKLPVTKRYLLIFEITLENPRIFLEEGSDRVKGGLDVVFNVKVNNNPKPFGGSVDISGGVKYQPESGEFYLTKPVVEKLAVQGLTDEYADKFSNFLGKALNEYYSKNPIYTLSASRGNEAIAKMVLKRVVVENKELVLTLGI